MALADLGDGAGGARQLLRSTESSKGPWQEVSSNPQSTSQHVGATALRVILTPPTSASIQSAAPGSLAFTGLPEPALALSPPPPWSSAPLYPIWRVTQPFCCLPAPCSHTQPEGPGEHLRQGTAPCSEPSRGSISFGKRQNCHHNPQGPT